MNLTTIDEIFRFAGSGLRGTVAVLREEPSRPRRRAALLLATLRGKQAAELGEQHGIWHLTVPCSGGTVAFRTQTREAAAPGGQHVSFGDRAALAALGTALKSDELFQTAFEEFATATVLNLARIGEEHGLHFELLDGLVPAERIPVLADKHSKPGQAGWVGVDVVDFATCLSNCEQGAKPWEVWVHAYCLVKCGIKSGTAGGPLFK
jgi:hypothetical protein